MSELRGLEAVHKQLLEKGGSLVAISADQPAQSRTVALKNEIEFPLLSDPDCEVIREFGLFHENGRPGGGDIAIPAQFLFDSTGKLVYHFESSRPQDRVAPLEMAERIAGL